MNSLIIYDSMYGNTEKIASAIYKSIISPNKSKMVKINEANIKDLEGINLLIVGSPVQGGRPTQNLQMFLDRIPVGKLKNVKVATFDTRFLEEKQNFALKLLLKTIGYASPKMADLLKSKGGKLIDSPQGFIVLKKEGPLDKDELKKAKIWAKKIISPA